ncbi:MAG TPA: hypothetical protein VNZ57_05775 [Longimicrobiales bacterium]|nr:hypothetical protein [Longimicrobiales bacterium]
MGPVILGSTFVVAGGGGGGWVLANFASGAAYDFVIAAPDGRYLGGFSGCGLNQIGRVDRRANLGYRVRTSATRAAVATAAGAGTR